MTKRHLQQQLTSRLENSMQRIDALLAIVEQYVFQTTGQELTNEDDYHEFYDKFVKTYHRGYLYD